MNHKYIQKLVKIFVLYYILLWQLQCFPSFLLTPFHQRGMHQTVLTADVHLIFAVQQYPETVNNIQICAQYCYGIWFRYVNYDTKCKYERLEKLYIDSYTVLPHCHPLRKQKIHYSWIQFVQTSVSFDLVLCSSEGICSLLCQVQGLFQLVFQFWVLYPLPTIKQVRQFQISI